MEVTKSPRSDDGDFPAKPDYFELKENWNEALECFPGAEEISTDDRQSEYSRLAKIIGDISGLGGKPEARDLPRSWTSEVGSAGIRRRQASIIIRCSILTIVKVLRRLSSFGMYTSTSRSRCDWWT